MKNDLHASYSLEKIDFLRDNKNEITSEILADLRSHGISGKQLALDILELKEDEKYSAIHIEEFEKCKNDVIYFKDNYLLILNKDELQDKMLNAIKTIQNVHITSGSGTKKSYAACIYALWMFNFQTKKTIGIASYKSIWSKEMVSNITNLQNYIPNWMKIKSKNLKTYMTSDGQTQIITDLINGNAFRGRTLDLLIVDCLENVKADLFKEFQDTVMPSLTHNKAKVVYIGLNPEIVTNAISVDENYTLFVVEAATKEKNKSIFVYIKDLIKTYF